MRNQTSDKENRDFGLTRWVRRLCVLCALAIGVGLSVPAVAAPLQGEAKRHFDAGVRLYGTQNYDEARQAFLQSFAATQHPSTLAYLAQSELRSGHPAEAATHFAELFSRSAEDLDPGERQEAELGFAAAKLKAGALRVEVGADEAEILVDGATRGHSPLEGPLYLAPGSHLVEARKGADTASSPVTVTAGKEASVKLTLGAAATAAAPVAAAPEDDTEHRPDFELTTGGPRPPFIEWFKREPIAWVGAGFTGVGLLGAVVFAVTSGTHYARADDLKNEILAVGGRCLAGQDPRVLEACAKRKDAVDTGDTQKTIAFVSLGGAVLAAGGTVAYYYFHKHKQPATARPLTVVPLVGVDVRGVGLTGSF